MNNNLKKSLKKHCLAICPSILLCEDGTVHKEEETIRTILDTIKAVPKVTFVAIAVE